MPAGGLNMTFSMFFDRRPVLHAADKAKRQVMSKAGAFIRTAAKSSLKSAPQKTLAEMSAEEREIYAIRIRKAERRGRRKPRRPERRSRPGRPPLLHMRPSPLKRLIYFGYDRAADSVVVGPLRFGRRPGADVLERGGTARIRGRRRRVAARPFMGPALAQELPKFPSLWRDSVRRA
ncbi:MAG TPA: hypothetical protein VM219_09070 [Phycisphaerae bacterium]|nr:hypothetical protein [Phycisphaerae bacterium]HUX02981.1 hypothetical protein [Phycisphaerae bacterium]